MKNLVIDIGNTAIKWGIFENEQLLKANTSDNWENMLEQLSIMPIQYALISSVSQSTDWIETILDTKNIQYFELNASLPIPLQNTYHTPNTLGMDRLAAAVGANFLFPNQAVLLIDIGTAIKYDYISSENTFEGGIISPGMRIRFEALHSFTKKLPLVNAIENPPLVGKSTEQCIQSGVINGIIAEIEGMIENYQKLGINQVIFCGGDATFFESQIKKATFAKDFSKKNKIKNTNTSLIPDLTLIGLNRILKYNVEKK